MTINPAYVESQRVGHTSYVATAMARPANTTAYSSGQALAQSLTLGSCSPISIQAADKAGFGGAIERVRIRKSGTSITTCTIRAHFFKTLPTGFVADASAFAANNAGYIGAADVTITQAFLDGAFGVGTPNVGPEMSYVLPAGQNNLWVLFEVRSAYTPASAETFTVEIEVKR